MIHALAGGVTPEDEDQASAWCDHGCQVEAPTVSEAIALLTCLKKKAATRELDGLQPGRPDDGQTETPNEGTIVNNANPIMSSSTDNATAPTSVDSICDTRTYLCSTVGCLDYEGTHVLEPYVDSVLHVAFSDTRRDWYAEVYKSESNPEQGWVVEAQLDTSGPIPVEVAHEFMVTLTGCYTLAGQLNGAA